MLSYVEICFLTTTPPDLKNRFSIFPECFPTTSVISCSQSIFYSILFYSSKINHVLIIDRRIAFSTNFKNSVQIQENRMMQWKCRQLKGRLYIYILKRTKQNDKHSRHVFKVAFT